MEANNITVEEKEVKKGFFKTIKETKANLKGRNQELINKHPVIGYLENGAKVAIGGAAVVGAYVLGKKAGLKAQIFDEDGVVEVIEETIETME